MFLFFLLSCGSDASELQKSKKEVTEHDLQEEISEMQQKIDCMSLIVSEQELPAKCEIYLVNVKN